MAITVFGIATAAASAAQDLRLVRSVSGPSGKVDGSKFVLDEVRSRFVHPQDKSFVVYFEWEGLPGMHVLTALWKRPDGRVDSVSPDVKINSSTRELTAYWTYILDPEMMPGVWSVEVRVDGRPAGSHTFEIAGTVPPQTHFLPETAPRPPTLDEIFRATLPSLVWVRRFDATGKRIDSASGFVVGKDRIVTALQAVDGASKLEIEFAGGRKVETDEILAYSRSDDWAIVAVTTLDIPALQLGDAKTIGVGEHLIAFNVEGDARTIGGLDISGKRNVQGFGERIQLSPTISLEAAGGPLLDGSGRVVGILGGSLLPGGRFAGNQTSVNPSLGIATSGLNAAVPASTLPRRMPDKASKLVDLVATGALTAPLFDVDGLLYVGTSTEIGKHMSDPLPRDVWEFSRHDKQVWVVSEWQKKGKVSKGKLAARVYDDQNRVRIVVEPKKISLSANPMRSAFAFETGTLSPGFYRIDLTWNGQPVRRTFIRVTD
ncbi:MAG TPA: serine protease [Bryobacteraceae bacterium]|nr:serine protease [Bryobacteraceae bacterium]